MSIRFLTKQIELLVELFGYDKVVRALKKTGRASESPLARDIGESQPVREPSKTARPRKMRKSRNAVAAKKAEELISSQVDDEKRAVLLRLKRLYESKLFLPELRVARNFLRDMNADLKPSKSRMEALPTVIRTLSKMSAAELRELADESASRRGDSEFSLLARQIMGKP